jgi:hypothetical protein
MLRWRDLHPYNAVHVVHLRRPLPEVPLAERIAGALEARGLTGFVLDRTRRRYRYEGGPAEVALAILPGGADPLAALRAEIERQLNLPFADGPRRNPFRFFAVAGAGSFHLGLVYDHFVAGGESIVFLLNAIGAACTGVAPTPAETVAPDLYPATYRTLAARHPGAFLRAVVALPRLVARSRRSFRPRYGAGGGDVAFAYFRLDPGELAALRRAGRDWGVTTNDLFLAGLLLALAPFAAERRRRARRTALGVASIVSAREDFDAEPQRVFGQFLSSFSVVHPVPEGIGLRELARDIHAETARIRRERRYLQTVLALGVAGLMWPFLSAPRRAGFFAKYHPVWGGVTTLNVDGLWRRSGRGELSWDYFRAGPTGPLCPLVLAATTARDTLHVGLSYRTSAFSRAEMDAATARFRAGIEGLKEPACRAA